MKRTIIYVFGPKRLTSQYFSNIPLKQEDGGWLKIGQTDKDDEGKDKWDCAMSRINQEVHTGIPVTCQLFEAFEYPCMSGKTDDKIRHLLTHDLYELECSKAHNKEINKAKYEIKAGDEFVYGVTRKQILNAVAKFERDLILEYYGKEEFGDFMELIKRNNSGELPFEVETEGISAAGNETSDSNNAWNDKLWDQVIAKVKDIVQQHINNPKGRPYIYFDSSKHEDFNYDCSYSVRYGFTTVSITTQKGDESKKNMQEFITANNVLSVLPDLQLKQGAKNEDKWSWIVYDTLEKTEEEIVDWFAKTIIAFYNTFEK
jgi:hypothetical protein